MGMGGSGAEQQAQYHPWGVSSALLFTNNASGSPCVRSLALRSRVVLACVSLSGEQSGQRMARLSYRMPSYPSSTSVVAAGLLQRLRVEASANVEGMSASPPRGRRLVYGSTDCQEDNHCIRDRSFCGSLWHKVFPPRLHPEVACPSFQKADLATLSAQSTANLTRSHRQSISSPAVGKPSE